MQTTNLKKALAAAAVSGVLAFGVPLSAQAATYDVWGQLNTGGALIQYSTFRSHLAGNASLRIYNNVGTYSRFGLRGTDGEQKTSSLQYNGSGGDQSWGWVATGSYALNGRMGAQRGADNYWAGTLNL